MDDPEKTVLPSPQALIVEDEKLLIGPVKAVLKQVGYEVIAYAEGNQALAYLQTNTPDLIFLDRTLPDISGEEIVAWLDQQPRMQNTKIVIISATLSLPNQLVGRAAALLPKPFDLNELREIAALFKPGLD